MIKSFFLVFFLIGCVASIPAFGQNPSENQNISIPFFMESVSFSYQLRSISDGEVIDAYITTSSKKKIYVDRYESEGAAPPQVKGVFVEGKFFKKLFIIVAWDIEISSLDTSGSIYKVFIYDERLIQDVGMLKLPQDVELMKRFGAGFDGVREGDCLKYKYKTAASIKRQLIKWGIASAPIGSESNEKSDTACENIHR